ncbi:MAG: GAF domain-containing protein, partial [Alphaproteobacteria bacterium]|nr:GAF domain-containing protein [Alphaproteobacteria bacterium]
MIATQDEANPADAIAMLRQRLDAALAREAALAEVLTTIAASPDDPQPVFEMIARHARALCGADQAGVTEFDGTLIHMRAAEGYAPIGYFPRPPDDDNLHGRLVLHGAAIHIRDFNDTTERSYAPISQLLGSRSLLAVPLRRDGRVIGGIVVRRNAPGGFDDTQVAMLESFAAQAVIAMENARLLTETREALERQTATADILKVINTAQGDLAPVFDAILEKAHLLCGATIGSLMRYDGALFHAAATHGLPPSAEAVLQHPMLPTSRHRELMDGGRFVHVTDLAGDPGAGSGVTQALLADTGVRTLLLVPLRHDNAFLGFISAFRDGVRPFAEREIALLESFAAQAAIAMENARLLTEQREALERQTATAEVLGVINANPGNLAPVFETILAKAHALCGADSGALGLFDGANFRKVARHGYSVEADDALSRPYPAMVEHAPLLRGETIHVPDVLAHSWERPAARQFMERSGLRTWLEVPLFKDGTLLGTVSGWRRAPRAFQANEVALLESFAAQAVIAMENARLLGEQQEALERQTATAEVLGVINANPGNLAPVFNAILEKAHHLCDAGLGSLQVLDGGQLRAVAVRGMSDALADYLKAGFAAPEGLLHGDGQAMQVADLAAFSAQNSSNPAAARLWGELTGLRALLVPLHKDGVVLGRIVAARGNAGPFTDRQIALLENFAAQAVIAMENARLLEELRARDEDNRRLIARQSASIDILKAISASPDDPRPVFDAIISHALALCDSAQGSVAEFDGTLIDIRSMLGMAGETATILRGWPRRPDRETMHGRVVLAGDTVHVRDVAADATMSARNRELADRFGYRSMLGVPLLRDGRVIGSISMTRTAAGGFADDDIALVESFAEQAVIAIAGAQALHALGARTADLQESLDYQTATSDVLKVISRSTFDLQPVLDTLVATAARLSVAETSAIFIRDGEMWRQLAQFGLSPEYVEFIRGLGAHPMPPDNPTAVARAVNEARVVHIEDAAAIPGYGAANLSRQRTTLGVPMLRGGEVVGVIVLARTRVEAFTQRQIDLITTFADQAVIAIENTRLITETREALERQTATAEVLAVINANPGNLAPVFEAVLERALGLCGAAFGILRTYDGERVRAIATRGVPAALAEFSNRFAFIPAGLMKRVLETGRSEQDIDVRDDEGYRTGSIPAMVAMADLGGARTVLQIPLIKDQGSIGLITFYRQEVRPFTDKQIALLENFAAQAVIAMENARLITETQEALERQTATAEVLQVINANPGNLAPVFDVILAKAHSLCGADRGCLFLNDGTNTVGVAVNGYGEDVATILRQPNPIAENSSAQVLLAGARYVHTDDIRARTQPPTSAISIAVQYHSDVRTNLIIPLRKDGALLGLISANRSEVRPYRETEIALLESFAAQAVIAIENARLLNEVRQRQNELRVTFENMGDGVAMFDETHTLVAWNRKFQDILDLPDGALAQGLPFADFVRHQSDRGEYGGDAEAQVARITAGIGQARVTERTRPNGRVLEIRTNPVAGGGFVVIYADITERKRAEAAIAAARDAAEQAARTIEAAYRDLKIAQANLIQAEKMASLGQLTAGIAHEIKNPLNFVNNFSDLSVELLAELTEAIAPTLAGLDADTRADVEDITATLTSNLQKITQHGKRADGIVRAMLEHSRGSSGERRAVDLNAEVEEALNLAFHGARAQNQSFNITLERDYAQGMAPITLTPQDITRVFLNLFNNG